MILLQFNENRFSFFVADQLASCVQIPRAIGAFYHVWKWHNVHGARSEMRRCTTHALNRSKLYNRTIASTLKIQIRTVQRLRVMKTKFPAVVMVFGVVSSEGIIMPPRILEVGLKVNTKMFLDVLKSVVIPWCNQVAGGRPWVWQQDSAPAHKSKETQVWLQKECYDFVPFSHSPSPPPNWTRWTTSFGHTSRTSPTWPPTTPKPAWSPPSAEYSPSSRRRWWKRHAPSSGSVSRWWLRLKAATLNRCQLYNIIKLPELIFSIKVLK